MSEFSIAQTHQTAKPVVTPAGGLTLQRQCACGQHTTAGGECAECRKKRLSLQRKAVNHAEPTAVPPAVHEVPRSPGQRLDPATRAFMEPRFGHDFSNVRVHTDTRSAESARTVQAMAYTVGRDIVFGTGRYSPHTGQGQRLLAHELTHVVQQQHVAFPAVQPQGDKSSAYAEGFQEIPKVTSTLPEKKESMASVEVAPTYDSFEREADRIADQIISFGPLASPQLRRKQALISRQLDDQTTGKSSSTSLKQTPRGTLSYRDATELATCIRIMGTQNTEYCRQEVLGEKPQPRHIEITRTGGGGQTFISTDTLTFTAQMLNPPPGTTPPTHFNWMVDGISLNAGNGNPHSATNQARFSFRPNPTRRPTSGSRVPNDPIQYRIEAMASGGRGTFELVQDETDIIRQEYVDLRARSVPDRGDIVTPTVATFNTGNYTLIVDGGMDNALTNTETEFSALTPAGNAVPAISVSSGYRNPRRNVAVGSVSVNSRHVRGTALDLTVARANATLWDRLRQAGRNAGNTSICEVGPTQVPCNDPNVDHVHIQW